MINRLVNTEVTCYQGDESWEDCLHMFAVSFDLPETWESDLLFPSPLPPSLLFLSSSFPYSFLPFSLNSFLPFSSYVFSQLYSIFFFFMCVNQESSKRERGTWDQRSFWCFPGFMNGNFKRSQKNLFSFLPPLNWRAHLTWPAHPRGASLRNYLLIHWLDSTEGRGIKHGDPLSSESFESPSRGAQEDGFSVTFQQLISFKNWIKAAKGFCQMDFAHSWVFGSCM